MPKQNVEEQERSVLTDFWIAKPSVISTQNACGVSHMCKNTHVCVASHTQLKPCVDHCCAPIFQQLTACRLACIMLLFGLKVQNSSRRPSMLPPANPVIDGNSLETTTQPRQLCKDCPAYCKLPAFISHPRPKTCLTSFGSTIKCCLKCVWTSVEKPPGESRNAYGP